MPAIDGRGSRRRLFYSFPLTFNPGLLNLITNSGLSYLTCLIKHLSKLISDATTIKDGGLHVPLCPVDDVHRAERARCVPETDPPARKSAARGGFGLCLLRENGCVQPLSGATGRGDCCDSEWLWWKNQACTIVPSCGGASCTLITKATSPQGLLSPGAVLCGT